MDTRILEYFIEIANENSLSGAAKKLYISQPALSQQLKKLESQIGTPLFERNGNSIALTDAGKIFLNGAQSIMHVKAKAYQQINMQKQHATDSIQCMINHIYMDVFHSAVYPEFKQSFPHIAVHTRPAANSVIIDYLINGLIDFAVILTRTAEHPALEFIPLAEDEMVLALPCEHPYIEKHPGKIIRDFTVLSSEPFILSSADTDMSSVETSILNSHQFSPDIQYIAGDCNSILSMVADCTGIAFLPASQVKKCGQLCFYRIEPTVPLYSSIVHNKSLIITPPLACLFQFIRQAIQADDKENV